jgi:hypothetical protein
MPDPDIRYVGIQNYGAAGSDVVYNEQSRAVGEIPVFIQGKGGNATKSWAFVHYSEAIGPRPPSVAARIHRERARPRPVYTGPSRGRGTHRVAADRPREGMS